MFHNVKAIYENVNQSNLLFESTVFDGQELMVLGKLNNHCELPPRIQIGNDVLDDTNDLYDCDHETGDIVANMFPENELKNPSGLPNRSNAAEVPTSLGKLVNSGHLFDLKFLVPNLCKKKPKNLV